MRAKGGFDLVAQGASGLMSVTGEPGGPPVKAGVPLTDLGAGLFALAAILAALHHRHATGRGQYIDTSLLEAGLALSVWESAEFFAGGARRSHWDRRIGFSRRIRRFDARTVTSRSARAPIDCSRLSRRSSGIPNGAAMPDFADASARVRNRAALDRADRGGDGDAAESALARGVRGRGIPCGPINTYAEAFADPQVQAREMVVDIDHPTLGRMPDTGSADQDVRNAARRSTARAAAR